jgi:hypothetical protein
MKNFTKTFQTTLLLTGLLLLTAKVQSQSIITVPDAVGLPDSTVIIEIEVNSVDPFVAVQFDFLVPEGFVYVENSVSIFPPELLVQGGMIPGQPILRFITFSLTNAQLYYVLFSFDLNTPSQTGVYPLDVINAIIGNIQGENILDEIINGTVTITGIDLPGDSNCDGVVNVLDVTQTAQYALGIPVAPFCFENADVNEDGIINVADVTGTIAIILNQGQ